MHGVHGVGGSNPLAPTEQAGSNSSDYSGSWCFLVNINLRNDGEYHREVMMRIELNGGYLEYSKVGSGIPMLFVHGYPLSQKIWEPQISGLSELATIITTDLRGHGDSYPFDGAYTMDLLAEDCKHVLDELGVNTPVVACGLSMGGYVLFSLYRSHPDLFRGLILTSTRSGSDTEEGKINRDLAIKDALERGAGAIADSMLPKMFSPSTLSSNTNLVNQVREMMSNTSDLGIIGALQGMRDRLDSTSLLGQISCPVLIVHGKDDQLIPVGEAELMHQNISNSNLVVVENAGHLLNLEQPDRFNQAVRKFISSLD
jgi:3-oxoadipate enol-lactonase